MRGGIQKHNSSMEAISGGSEGCRVSLSCQSPNKMHIEDVRSAGVGIMNFDQITQAAGMRINASPAVTRIPFLECTNTKPGISKERELHPKKNVKGQWKRRARMQGKEIQMDCLGGNEVLEEGNKKRDWECWEGEQENTFVMQAVKKGKLHSSNRVAKASEVEDTSRNWS